MYKKGFTLIELLIVVAIIAILAAIAIPNFLAAQIRAKVTHVKAGSRNIATALEAYRVDSNAYPPMWRAAQPQYPEILTSPVPYMTGLPLDLFKQWRLTVVHDPYYRVIDYIGFKVGDYTNPYHYWDIDAWLLYSYGPDGDRDWIEYYYAYHSLPGYAEGEGIYDPTNGTVSNGDIARYGP